VSGESNVGAGSQDDLVRPSRLARDIDVFHDAAEAVAASWEADRKLLASEGLTVTVVRERPGFVEADVTSSAGRVRLEWAADSAFRFFPLQEHADLGLTLHPFDLATNKVLALVGREEVRDWVDVVACDEYLQPLGYLAWAACGKDPGFSPLAILEIAARSGRYSAEEVRRLDWSGDPPDAAALSRAWHGMLASARAIVALLPPEEVGTCVLQASALDLFRGGPDDLRSALDAGALRFHRARLGGALPRARG